LLAASVLLVVVGAMAILVLLILQPSARAQSPPLAAVPSVGAMQDIPGAHEKPDPAARYKIVFDVRTLADDAGDISPALRAIAALLNTYRRHGVPPDHLQLTAVFHGPTIVLLARDAVYARRTGAQNNPNLVLLRELASAGVELAVCGQSARAQHYADADLVPLAQLNLSATVTFINLQTRGYVKVDE
jgi:intracellular sulfur oxidation DsrE/DsrF family protein